MAMMTSLRWLRSNRLRRLARSERGSAAVELAFVAPILAALTLGGVEAGTYYFLQMQAKSAAQEGADYAIKYGYNAAAVQAAAEYGNSNLTATSSQFCGCANATTGISTVAGSPPTCTGSCGDGSTPGTYVSVTAQLNYTPAADWPFIKLPTTVSATSVVRTQ